MPDIEFLTSCPTLNYLRISPSYDATEKFSFRPLYEMNNIKYLICDNVYGDNEEFCAELDCAKLKGVEFLSISYNEGILNLTKLESLKTLRIRDFQCKGKNLKALYRSKRLDTLELNECRIQSLDGIEYSEKMQCLYINYNRTLKDISSLKKIKDTLKTLHIEKCPKIEDFSVLEELENLESLELIGNNKLPNLKFLRTLKNLKTFVFEYDVLDGDLTYCLNIPNVHCERNRKHYNLKNEHLPKGKFVFGNEDIEEWRRLE